MVAITKTVRAELLKLSRSVRLSNSAPTDREAKDVSSPRERPSQPSATGMVVIRKSDSTLRSPT